MKASFASITTHPTMSAEELIAYKARVSSPQNQDKHDTAERLLRYCLRMGHWSPFEMADLTIELETSRAIMAQILRHKSFSFQEFSQRYADPSAAGLGFEPVEIRRKHEKGNRQGSGDSDEAMTMEAQEIIAEAGHHYGSLIERGAAPESARFALSLATTTRAYMKGSARSWITYFFQRLCGHAQKEHRELAWLMFDIFQEYFPVIAGIILEGKTFYVERQKIIDLIGSLQDRPGFQKEIEYLESLVWNPKR